MANVIGTAVLELTTDDSKLQAGLRGAEQETRGWLGTLQTAVGTALGFAGAIVGLNAISSAFGFAQESVFGLNNRLQQATIAFTTMLGSGEKAKAFLDDLARFAAKTPFEFPDLVTATQRMMAYGFQAEQVIPLLTAVGNASAALGLGAEGIDRVTTALGQMRAKGKVAGEEMRQLAEAGIPAWDMLAKKLGVDVATAMKMVEDRAVDANVMIEAFMEGVGERFPNMMEKQSRTFAGAMSTIKDSLQMGIATAFRPFFDLVTAGMVKLADILSSDAFQQFAQRVAGAIQGLIDRAREFLPSIQQLFSAFSEPGAASGVLAILNPLGALAREVLPALIPLFQTLAQVLAQLATTVGPPVAQLIAQIGAVLRDAIAQVLPYVVQLFQQLAPVFGQILAALVPLISQGLQVLISAILPPLIDLLSQVLSWLANNETAVKVLAGALVALIAVMNPIPAAITGIIAVVGLLSQHWDDIEAKTLEVWGSIRDFLTQNWQEILSIASLFLLGPGGLVVLFTTNAFGIRDKVTGAMEQLKAQLEGIWNAAKEALEGIWNALKGAGEAIFGALRDALSGIADSARGLVVSAFEAMKDGVVGAVSALRDLAAGIMGNARDLVAGAADTARDLVVGAFNAMGHGVGMALWDLLVTVRGIPGQILAALGDLGGLLWDAGRALIEGLIGGIRSKIPDLKDALGGLKGLLPDWKGPLADDRRLLVPHGRAIMEGLMAGIESSLPDLRSLLGDVTSLVVGAPPQVPAQGALPTPYAPVSVNITVQERDVAAEVERVLRRALFQAGWR